MTSSTSDRKAAFKLPPSSSTDIKLTQGTRRAKALEEQKRRRSQKFDASRQLDLFAQLTLGGPSDDEELEETERVNPAAVAQYVSMLEPDVNVGVGTSTAPPVRTPTTATIPVHVPTLQPPNAIKKPRKRKKQKATKWADKCMYAELLEMADDDPWSSSGMSTSTNSGGLPEDLESAWIAVAPVPVGKRCLAVTHQTSGISGVVANTSLRSRLLGKLLIPRFPSNLPALTILDCILDANWRENGILHVLDVIQWKGQDIGDCETPFRFWWRDTRLAELAKAIPPPSRARNGPGPNEDGEQQQPYHFPYPTTLVPIPYHTDTSLSTLNESIIPSARSLRSITITRPFPALSTFSFTGNEDGMMDAEAAHQQQSVSVNVAPDGLLLYMSEASYESGTSPLSSWVPIVHPEVPNTQRPLDLLQKLVKREMSKKNGHGMDVDSDI